MKGEQRQFQLSTKFKWISQTWSRDKSPSIENEQIQNLDETDDFQEASQRQGARKTFFKLSTIFTICLVTDFIIGEDDVSVVKFRKVGLYHLLIVAAGFARNWESLICYTPCRWDSAIADEGYRLQSDLIQMFA